MISTPDWMQESEQPISSQVNRSGVHSDQSACSTRDCSCPVRGQFWQPMNASYNIVEADVMKGQVFLCQPIRALEASRSAGAAASDLLCSTADSTWDQEAFIFRELDRETRMADKKGWVLWSLDTLYYHIELLWLQGEQLQNSLKMPVMIMQILTWALFRDF